MRGKGQRKRTNRQNPQSRAKKSKRDGMASSTEQPTTQQSNHLTEARDQPIQDEVHIISPNFGEYNSHARELQTPTPLQPRVLLTLTLILV